MGKTLQQLPLCEAWTDINVRVPEQSPGRLGCLIQSAVLLLTFPYPMTFSVFHIGFGTITNTATNPIAGQGNAKCLFFAQSTMTESGLHSGLDLDLKI